MFYVQTKRRRYGPFVGWESARREVMASEGNSERMPRGYSVYVPEGGTVPPEIPEDKLRGPGAPTAPKVTEPTKAEPKSDLESAMREFVEGIAARSVDEDKVREIVKAALDDVPARRLEIVEGAETRTVEGAHPDLERVVKWLQVDNVLLVGPTGSGKTTLAEQVAEALGVQFFVVPQCMMAHDVLGFNNVSGYQTTPFREAYEKGGVVLCDEFDSWGPQAALAFNAATSNGYAVFPDSPEPVKKHERCYVLAAANTWGHGPDREYVGRNQLDAATLNRFIPLEIDYNETLEKSLAGDCTDWLATVHRARSRARELSMRHAITTREVVRGRKAKALGISEKEMEKVLLQRNLTAAEYAKLQ